MSLLFRRRLARALSSAAADSDWIVQIPGQPDNERQFQRFDVLARGLLGVTTERICISLGAATCAEAVTAAAPLAGVRALVVVDGNSSLAAECLSPDIECVSAVEFINRVLPWPDLLNPLREGTVPPDFDLERFERRFYARSAEVLEDGARVVIDLDAHLDEWIRRPAAAPILLVAHRGEGKTWQLLRFCARQNERLQQGAADALPAIYFNLQHTHELAAGGSANAWVLDSLLLEQYGRGSQPWFGRLLPILVDGGCVVPCLDGLDEMRKQPSDREVDHHIRRVTSGFGPGARWLLASRSTHFESVRVLRGHTAPFGSRFEQYFEICRLLTFAQVPTAGGLRALYEGDASDVAILATVPDHQRACLKTALQACSAHPAILSRLEELLARNGALDASALRDVLMDVYIRFNLSHERTRREFRWVDDNGAHAVPFSEPERAYFLAEVAWFLAQRGYDSFTVDQLPQRLALQFGLETDIMRRDVRSQLVFEWMEGEVEPADDSFRLRFAIRMGDVEPRDAMQPWLRAHLDAVARTSPVSSDSIAGAVFLAEFLSDRVRDSLGSEVPNATLRFLGEVPIGKVCAAVLRQHLDAISAGTGLSLMAHLRTSAIDEIVARAREGGASAFRVALRHLVPNLALMGILPPHVVTRLSPWEGLSGELAGGVQGGRDVLVPRPRSARLEHLLGANRLGVPAGEAFLLSIHEVTNDQYAAFVDSDAGADWRVRRITRAGSGRAVPPSRHHLLTNEYHLYMWQPDAARDNDFHPPASVCGHPVVYVSWYAAAAYCDWLSELTNRVPRYRSQIDDAREPVDHSGYRLPLFSEWLWAAFGDADDVEFPWDLLERHGGAGVSPPGRSRIVRKRNAARDSLLGQGKNTNPVLQDEVSEFGVAGLLGNVKEWVHDIDPAERAKKIILGATAYLGENSFRFGYFTSLFSENTNPDVGFRVARSLSPSESEVIHRREYELERLDTGALLHAIQTGTQRGFP